MTVAAMKHGGQCYWLGKMFIVKGPTFERYVMKFNNIITGHVYNKFFTSCGEACEIYNLVRLNSTFSNFPHARYATDVMFQMAFRPSVNVQEVSIYFSVNHNSYGYKVEVSVTPTVVAVGCTKHHPGSTSDLAIFRQNKEFHDSELDKLQSEVHMPDVGAYPDEHWNCWAVLV